MFINCRSNWRRIFCSQ